MAGGKHFTELTLTDLGEAVVRKGDEKPGAVESALARLFAASLAGVGFVRKRRAHGWSYSFATAP